MIGLQAPSCIQSSRHLIAVIQNGNGAIKEVETWIWNNSPLEWLETKVAEFTYECQCLQNNSGCKKSLQDSETSETQASTCFNISRVDEGYIQPDAQENSARSYDHGAGSHENACKIFIIEASGQSKNVSEVFEAMYTSNARGDGDTSSPRENSARHRASNMTGCYTSEPRRCHKAKGCTVQSPDDATMARRIDVPMYKYGLNIFKPDIPHPWLLYSITKM
ncbi:hypothetical protein C8J56DRAFT_899473 [Mycena floridula]|nr:hypothetical protein C8J56DRAFT_899473 [Mycena floridula]